MLTFKLTTPLMGSKKGTTAHKQVTILQTQLKHHGYLSGKVDGVYGHLTAQAVYRAKFYLGYRKPDNVAGSSFYLLLTGKHKPSPIMVALSHRRHAAANKKAAQTPIGVKALRLLIKNTGMKEHPSGSNRCTVSLWYGLIGPWCAMTGMWAYDHAGSKVFNRANGHKYGWAYVPNIVHDARNGNHGLTITHNPYPGCGIAYDWPGESPGLADHWGTFERWINKSAGTFFAREGNTAVGNDSNGGELMQRERSVSLVQAFVTIK